MMPIQTQFSGHSRSESDWFIYDTRWRAHSMVHTFNVILFLVQYTPPPPLYYIWLCIYIHRFSSRTASWTCSLSQAHSRHHFHICRFQYPYSHALLQGHVVCCRHMPDTLVPCYTWLAYLLEEHAILGCINLSLRSINWVKKGYFGSTFYVYLHLFLTVLLVWRSIYTVFKLCWYSGDNNQWW